MKLSGGVESREFAQALMPSPESMPLPQPLIMEGGNVMFSNEVNTSGGLSIKQLLRVDQNLRPSRQQNLAEGPS